MFKKGFTPATKGKLLAPEYKERVKKIATVMTTGEIGKYLGCPRNTVDTWVYCKDRSPRKVYRDRIDVLYLNVKDYVKELPDTVDVKLKSGERVSLPHPFKIGQEN